MDCLFIALRPAFILTLLTFQRLQFVFSTQTVDRGDHVYLQLLDSKVVPYSLSTISRLKSFSVRPSPSDSLPVEDLLENPDQSRYPSPIELDQDAMKRRLGHHLDNYFSSIETPSNLGNVTFKYATRNDHWKPSVKKPSFLRLVQTFRTADGHQVRFRGGRKQQRRLQKLLRTFTQCLVEYSWKDLGLRYWPRWLRQGNCWNKRSCSLPPGMTCRPSGHVNKHLLRWHCPRHNHSYQHRKHNSELRKQSRIFGRQFMVHVKQKCMWIRIQYPIITKCSCIC